MRHYYKPHRISLDNVEKSQELVLAFTLSGGKKLVLKLNIKNKSMLFDVRLRLTNVETTYKFYSLESAVNFYNAVNEYTGYIPELDNDNNLKE